MLIVLTDQTGHGHALSRVADIAVLLGCIRFKKKKIRLRFVVSFRWTYIALARLGTVSSTLGFH